MRKNNNRLETYTNKRKTKKRKVKKTKFLIILLIILVAIIVYLGYQLYSAKTEILNYEIKQARQNGEVSFELKMSQPMFLFRYGSLMKYKECFSF